MNSATILSSQPAFIPSSWNLGQQIAAAMAKCDADIEQTTLRQGVKENRRAERFMVAQSRSRRHRALYGI